MANVFGDFSEIQGVDEVGGKAVGEMVISKKFLKKLKKSPKKIRNLTKAIKRQNKLLQKIYEQHSGMGQTKNEKSDSYKENEEAKESIKTERSFGDKAADVFLKTLPSILRAVVSMVTSVILGHCFKRTGFNNKVMA